MSFTKIIFRLSWFILIGWWLGTIVFITGLCLSPTVIFTPLGYKMMDSGYAIATGKFE